MFSGKEPRRTSTGRAHSSTRERLLRELEAHGGASTAQLVEITGLHENTVRGHLESLRRDGHVHRERTQAAGRGRPAWRWQAVSAARLSPYAGLAATLATALVRASSDPFAQARDAGTSWGRQLVDERPVSDGETRDARTLVIDVMREQGFAPDAAEEGTGIRLRTCPLLSAASENSTVVCAVHEGMVEGVARAVGSDLESSLVPFAEPAACLLHLRNPA